MSKQSKNRLNIDLQSFIKTMDRMDPEDPMFNKISEKCVAISNEFKRRRVNISPQQKHRKQNKVRGEYIMCYICFNKIGKAHTFYDSMCISCGTLNFKKRTPIKDLTGKYALVTGGRIKIGFETAIILLENSCNVIVTTRFSDDAIKRYSEHPNYQVWKDRLKIVQVDLLKHAGIVKLCDYVKEQTSHLDYLINNAAQTLNRPKAFYDHLNVVTVDTDNLVGIKCSDYFKEYQQNPQTLLMDKCQMIDSIKHDIKHDEKKKPTIDTLATTINDIVSDPNSLSEYSSKYFPPDKYDEHGQQVDLRPVNTWTQKLDDVNSTELLQVLIINTIAPFIIIQNLLSVMEKHGDFARIINVSSMEGKFTWKNKPSTHPHTNMAKAALNMMTRTCGKDFKVKNILIVAVDTGWNTIEHPNCYNEKSPIDCIDGAARIVDPIFMNKIEYGIFYKNFKVISW